MWNMSVQEVFRLIQEYFDIHPPSEEIVYQFKIGDENFFISLKDKKAGPGECNGKPDLLVTTNEKDFLDISKGKITGQQAFMKGKLKLKGNMMLGMKLSQLLKPAKSKL